MSDSELFSLATQIFVRLRRHSGRTVDVIWLASNADYAAEVLRLAHDSGDADLAKIADRFAAALHDSSRPTSTTAPAPARTAPGTPDEVKAQYIGTLR